MFENKTKLARITFITSTKFLSITMAGSEEGTVKRTSSRLNKGISKYDRAKAALQSQNVLEESEMSESAAAAAERPKKKKKGPKKQEPKPISRKKTWYDSVR